MIKKSNNHIETENRLNEMLNVAERFTRTQRHLEQHSDITDPDKIAHAKEIQLQRISDINNLKDKIIYGDGGPTDELKNVNKNIVFSEGYLKNNGNHMSSHDRINLVENIINRKGKKEELTNNTNW